MNKINTTPVTKPSSFLRFSIKNFLKKKLQSFVQFISGEPPEKCKKIICIGYKKSSYGDEKVFIKDVAIYQSETIPQRMFYRAIQERNLFWKRLTKEKTEKILACINEGKQPELDLPTFYYEHK